MNTGKSVFSQIMEFMPVYEFKKCVHRYRGNYKVKNFSCLEQFYCMAFAQLTGRESLRDIESCLRSMRQRLYHMGIRSKISRSTIADANEKRDWRIYADFAQILIHRARTLYTKEKFGVDLQNTVYALDSTTIDLCLSIFPWATFRKTKGAVKLHTLLDLRGPIPAFMRVTEANIHDVNILDCLATEPGSFYVMDRAYLDFSRLYALHRASSFFVIPAKKNTKYKRLYSQTIDRSKGIRCDQIIRLTNHYAQKDYPEKLRRVRFIDAEAEIDFSFLTNNFTLSAHTIAKLYKCRWQVELFFKWIKQHLRIKAFYGTSINAVKTQIWIAVSIYVLIAIIKKELRLEYPLYTMLQILSLTQFEKLPIYQLLTGSELQESHESNTIQLNLFDL